MVRVCIRFGGVRHLFLMVRIKSKGIHFVTECPHKDRKLRFCVCMGMNNWTELARFSMYLSECFVCFSQSPDWLLACLIDSLTPGIKCVIMKMKMRMKNLQKEHLPKSNAGVYCTYIECI